MDDLRGRRIAKLRRRLQTFVENLQEILRNLWIVITRRTRRSGCALNHHFVRRAARERKRSGEHFVEHDAQRVDVRSAIECNPLHLLRRHVMRRADHLPRFGQRGVLDGLGQTEIGDQDLPPPVDENVLRLEIAMDDALIMRRLQPLADLPEDVDDARQRQASFASQQGREVLTIDILHRQELDAAGFAEVVNAQDVFVSDVAGELDLALESIEDRRMAGEIEADHFQGDVAVELAIAREINLTHTALAEPLHDVVALAEVRPFLDAAAK